MNQLAWTLAGVDWIAYVSNVDREYANRIFELNEPIPIVLMPALDFLTTKLQRVVSEANPENPGGGFSLPFINWLREVSTGPSEQTNAAIRLRLNSGGETAVEFFEGSSDPVADTLAYACLTSFPAALVAAHPQTMVSWDLPRPSDEDGEQFSALVLSSDLAKLFPLHAEHPSTRRAASWQTPAWSMTPVEPKDLLHKLQRVVFLREFGLTGFITPSAIVKSARQVCADLRAMSDGRTADTPAVAAVSGIDTSKLPNQYLSTALGIVRPATGRDMDFIGVNLHLYTGWPRMSESEVAKRACILVVPSPDDIRARPIDGHLEDTPTWGIPLELDAHSELIHNADLVTSRRLRLLRLSIALASCMDRKVVASREMSRSYIRSSATGSGESNPTNETVPPWTVEVDASWAKRVRWWAQRISRLDLTNLDLAIDRILTAAHRFGSDGLVDAVVSWEAILGASENTAYRVRTGLAVCVEPTDINQRKIVQKRASEIYALRSHYVHGSSMNNRKLERMRASNPRDDAIILGLRLIGATLLQWPHTLTLDSEARSNEILLDGPTGILLENLTSA